MNKPFHTVFGDILTNAKGSYGDWRPPLQNKYYSKLAQNVYDYFSLEKNPTKRTILYLNSNFPIHLNLYANKMKITLIHFYYM